MSSLKNFETSPTNDGDFRDANWPVRYRALFHQICRIEILVPEAVNSFTPTGTGFLVGPNLILTNYHVLEAVINWQTKQYPEQSMTKPKNTRFRFDFHDTAISEVAYRLAEKDWLLAYSPPSPTDCITEAKRILLPSLNQLDYALVRLADTPSSDQIAATGDKRGWITLPEQPTVITAGDRMLVLQHPSGSTLKFDENVVIKVNKNNTRVLHKINTAKGSSGAPCFFYQTLELAAIHQASDPAEPPQYNQGIPISIIVEDLKRKGVYEQLLQPSDTSHPDKIVPHYLQEELRELQGDYQKTRKVKMNNPGLYDSRQIELQELKSDYDLVSEQIQLVRQQIWESIDLVSTASLEKKLDRLRRERRKLGEEITTLQSEIDSRPLSAPTPAATVTLPTQKDKTGETAGTDQDGIKKLIVRHTQRLQKLREQQAIYGNRADPSILIEIEDIEAKLEELRAQLKPSDEKSPATETDATEAKAEDMPANEARQIPSGFWPLTPSWIESYPDIHRLPTDDDTIATMLQGYSPFPDHRAEVELPFLFGGTGGFWSGHTVYAQIAGNPTVQVVLAEAGAGKTALAYALRQVGTPEGNPIPYTLPVVLDEHTPLTLANAKKHIAGAVLALLRHNPVLPARFSVAEKTFVLKYLVNQFGSAEVTRQLQAATRRDRSLPGLFNQFSETNQPASVKWLGETQHLLNILGFRQVALAVDANRRPARQIITWLNNMQKWGSYGINPILFLPLDRQHEFDSLLIRANLRVLTWTERQLAAMATWRFERLVNRIGVHLSLEELFEGELLADFVRLSNRNPRRMAQLWNLMAQYHAENRGNSRMFAPEDLSWAVEQVGK